jgi:Transglycosylase-like domain
MAEGDVWATFRECTFAFESGGNYQIVSRDGLYYGAWQFAIGTWNAVASRMGRDDLVGLLPSQASPADQDSVAHALWLESGNRPWGGRC